MFIGLKISELFQMLPNLQTPSFNLSFNRVPTQVLQSIIKSCIRFSVCKALQSLIFLVFLSKRSYKVLFLKEKKVSELEMWKLKVSC